MAADAVAEILETVRQILPGATPEQLAQIEARIRARHGRDRPYIARQAKPGHLQRLEAAMREHEDLTNQQLADLLGISVRQVQRYKPLVRTE